MNTLIVIIGPTGIGKTKVAIEVAEHFNIPIINADSRQMYAEIPIGTAAPTKEQQTRVKHFFVGNLHISDYYNASMFEADVMALLNDMFQENSIALMSGGSMMYIDTVCNGIDDIPTIDDTTRKRMKERLETEGLEALVDELKTLDYDHWKLIDKKNPRRIIHALEICHMTGNTYSSYLKRQRKERPFNIVKIGLTAEREYIYNRINTRVIDMLSQGFLEEARRVYPYRHYNSLNTVGYKELFEYFDGNISLDEAIRRIQSNTRRYCRKQQTWFKRDNTVRWFAPHNIKEIINYIENNLCE